MVDNGGSMEFPFEENIKNGIYERTFSQDVDNEELVYGENFFEQRGVIIASKNKIEHEKICLQLKEIIKENEIFSLNFS